MSMMNTAPTTPERRTQRVNACTESSKTRVRMMLIDDAPKLWEAVGERAVAVAKADMKPVTASGILDALGDSGADPTPTELAAMMNNLKEVAAPTGGWSTEDFDVGSAGMKGRTRRMVASLRKVASEEVDAVNDASKPTPERRMARAEGGAVGRAPVEGPRGVKERELVRYQSAVADGRRAGWRRRGPELGNR